MFFSIKVMSYDAKHGSKYSPFCFFDSTFIRYNDDVRIMVYVVDKALCGYKHIR